MALKHCEFCNDENNCISIKRKDQPDRILRRYPDSNVYVCGQCLAELRSRSEIRRDPFEPGEPYRFKVDIESEYKF